MPKTIEDLITEISDVISDDLCYFELIKYLVDELKGKDVMYINCLYVATLYNRHDLMQWLIDEEHYSPEGPYDGTSLLCYADLQGLKILLKAGADVNRFLPNFLHDSVLDQRMRYADSDVLKHGARPSLTLKWEDGPRRSLFDRAIVLPIILSPRLIPRIGARADIRCLPVEVVRLLSCFF